MQCPEFQRRLLEDPQCREPEFLQHERTCPACAAEAQRVRTFEHKLRAALEVPTPQGLEDGVLETKSFLTSHRRRPVIGRLFALAASLSLLTLLGAWISWEVRMAERRGAELPQSVVIHIEEEIHHMYERGPVAHGKLAKLFASYGAWLTDDLGEVNFAAECVMRGKDGIHLVFPGKRGPVTVLFMPEERVDSPQPVASDRFEGTILPTAWGSIAVVGMRGEVLEPVIERIQRGVAWPADPQVRA